ncbi:glycosyltransferase family 4 protein [Thalassovita sp.]|uniref:glycosyltransferase family 4 protein n=1 Tax=Thalassovita sp. TaxID=1979401 RepID=UPI002B26C6A2|nr:glycosyltransferase family 4 protein [Thalassovita sp.]
MTDVSQVDVIAPNFKKRLSGVTSTIFRLVPLQAEKIAIVATGPVIPADVPGMPLAALLTMNRRRRVWHARRNIEMIAGIALKTLLGKNLKLMFTSASQRHHTGLTKWLIRRMDEIVATSAKSAAYLERPAHVIHHGIDAERFSPSTDKAALRRQLGLPETGMLIGCYGRIRAQKGTDVFVDAMIRVLPRHPGATALVMGRATKKYQDFERELRDRVAAAGLSDRILFLPEVPVLEMAGFYQVLDLYVAPQRWEGFGLTPLEAMSCGAPVVATRVGAFEELVAEGETGTLVDPGDIDAMTVAVDAALSDPGRLAQWSTAARDRVLAQFQLQQEADALIAIYRRLLSD